jgi:diguanylate cyclase (GGDEF)-like protein
VAFIDLDGFKGNNHTFGHARGDDVLREAAAVLTRIARQGDVVARVGGDEFAVLFLNVSEGAARRLAQRASTELFARLGEYQAGCSVGLAVARAEDTPAALLARADTAMYQEKHQRRAGKARAKATASVCVLATVRPGMVLTLQRLTSARGVALVPIGRGDDVEALVNLLRPRLVLADFLFPPRGGQALLEALAPDEGGPRRRLGLVMPRKGFATQAGRDLTLEVVTAADDDAALHRLLAKVTPKDEAALPALESKTQAGELIRAVHELVVGRGLGPERLAAVGPLAEVELLQRALGV